MSNEPLSGTALVARTSLDFVSEMFRLNAEQRLVVTLRDPSRERGAPGVRIDRVITPGERFGWFTERFELPRGDQPAQVVLTSGTEGLPKAIVLTYANVSDAASRIIAEMQLTSDVREYVGVPPTFSFGLARFRAISAVGGRAYLSPRGFDLAEFAGMLRSSAVNALSVVPTLLRVLLDAPELFAGIGTRLRWLEIGSQFMSADEKRAIRRIFPNARIVQHYGLTEASRSTFLRISDASDEELESVGQASGSTEIALSRDGRIRIRGAHVARWRVDEDGLHPLLDADGWLQTNDLGHLRESRLYFDGRADDLINCAGVKIAPDSFEATLRDRLPAGARFAAARRPDPMRGEGILVAVVKGTADVEAVRASALSVLEQQGIRAAQSLVVAELDALPATATGKVRRSELAALCEQASMHSAAVSPSGTPDVRTGSDVMSLFGSTFPGQVIGRGDSFETLGGDSLTYVRFAMQLERRFGSLPDRWETLSVAQLESVLGGSGKAGFWRKLETATFVRAAGMICIVALHADAFIYSRNFGAAYALVMMAGYSVTRFQVPEIIRTGSVRTLLGTILRVAVPTLLMVLAMDALTHTFDWRTLTLFSNFADPRTLQGFYFYFAEFYIQLLLLAALFLSLPGVRRTYARWPMGSAVALFLFAWTAKKLIDQAWDTDYNFHRTPHNYAWAFAAGVLIASARDGRQRVLAMALIAAATWLAWGPTPADYYVAGACALVLFVPTVKVPAFLKIAVAEIASGSIFMYLTHYQVMSIVHRYFGEDRPWISLSLAVVVGIVCARCYEWTERLVLSTPWGMRFARLAHG